MSRLKGSTGTLKDFMHRLQVLNMYRGMNRAVRRIDDLKLRQSLTDEVRRSFRDNRGISDAVTLRTTMIEGNRQLKQLIALGADRSSGVANPQSWINGPAEEGEEPGRVGTGWPWDPK